MKATIWKGHVLQEQQGPEWEFSPAPVPLPRVSVVVACHGQLAYTQGLAASLKAHAGCDYELILVDNGCPDGTAAWAAREGYRCVRFAENRGVPAAYNAGVKFASGELIALWNNDMVCRPGGLRRLAEAAYRRGIAAQSGGLFTQAGDYHTCTGDAAWADYAEGYALVFLREVWERTGEWDETFFPSYSDDVDWCLRARLQGYDFTLVPECVTHFGQGTSAGMDLRREVREHQEIIRRRYLTKGLGQRVCVLRWGAAGDVIMATPTLRALKRELPLCRLHVHVEPGCGRVLAGLPYVDRRFQGPFQPLDYSRVVDLNGAYEWDQREGTWEHPVTAYCRRANVEYDGKPYDFRVPPVLQAWAGEVLQNVGSPGQLPTSCSTVLLAAGVRSGTRPKQNWRASGWLELANALPENYRLVALDSAPRPPLVGTPRPEDAAFYDHPQVLDLTGETGTLHHAAALLERCHAFVGVDSGLLHVAHALGKPLVALCSAAPGKSRLPLVETQASGFEGKLSCFPCQYRDPCPAGRHCLDWVTGRAVLEEVRALLA